MYITYVQYPWWQGEGIKFPGAGIHRWHDVLCGWEPNPGPIQELQALSTTKPSLHPFTALYKANATNITHHLLFSLCNGKSSPGF